MWAARGAKGVWIALGIVLAARALVACGEFSPQVGARRADAAAEPDCGAASEYADAGACGRPYP